MARTSEQLTPAEILIVSNLASTGYMLPCVAKSTDFTADLGGHYNCTATLTVTDPTPVNGAGFTVFVRNGTITVGGVAYSFVGSEICRVYHSGAWSNYVKYPRTVGSTASSATPTIDTNTYNVYQLTAQAADITSFTTNLSGSPVEGQMLMISITGTAARAITWGASFEASTVALPTTTVLTNRLDVLFTWNSATSKWRCLATS